MNKKYKIAVLPGDGIGPEVMTEGVKVLNFLGQVFNLSFEVCYGEIGLGAYKKTGESLPGNTIELIKSCDAILFGAVTTPPGIKNYQSPIVALRKMLNLYANIRPFTSTGLNLTIIRENTEGLYSGEEYAEEGGDRVIARRIITRQASEKVIGYAFSYAEKMNFKTLTVVHKANILRLSCGLFRQVALETAGKFPRVQLKEMLVDACAMQLIKDPAQFDLIVTTNMFGDILSDEASMLTGGLGIAYSCNMGDNTAIFEPVHGSAPDIAGKNLANPMAAFFSLMSLLEYLNLGDEAGILHKAIKWCIKEKHLTPDMGGTLSTSQVTRRVLEYLDKRAIHG